MRMPAVAAPLLLLLLGVSSANAQKQPVHVTGGNASLVLTKADIATCTAQALDGSVAAASRLADYYEAIRLDNEKALYWLQIAAENGGAEEMHSYWVIASQSNNPDDRRRAAFWLRTAARLGNKASQDELKRLASP